MRARSHPADVLDSPRSPLPGPPLPARESAETLLARNLVVARVASGATQQALAAAADVSRATVAQLETGCGDPRLSTLAHLAEALRLPLIFLLLGGPDVRALLGLGERLKARPLALPPMEVKRMRQLLRSGMLRDRLEAGRAGAEAARAAGVGGPGAQAAAAVFSAWAPGEGTAAGVAWVQALAEDESAGALAAAPVLPRAGSPR